MKINIGYNADLWRGGVKHPVAWNTETHFHFLVVGNTGSGKSYFQILTMAKLSKFCNVRIWLLDYKRNFDEYSDCPRYFGYEDCARGLNDYYGVFKSCLEGTENSKEDNHISDFNMLCCDEWGAFVMSRPDKKQSDDIKNKLSTLLMLGRNCRGKRFFQMICLQRADAEHFRAGSRDQFSQILMLGENKSQADMLFSAYKNELTEKNGRGQGYLLQDGKGIKRIIVPSVRDTSNLNEYIRLALTR